MTEHPSRYLITTADERTWKFDRPVIFLGEWCRLYDRMHIWHDMDAVVAVPYGLGQTRKDADHLVARALEDKLFDALYAVLNRYHGLQHGERFWRIMLGHWIRRYVDAMFNRIRTLEQCLQTYQISGTTAYCNDHYSLVTENSYAAIWAFNDERWNNALLLRILELLGATNCPVETITDCGAQSYRWETTATTPSLVRTILQWGRQQVGRLVNYFARDCDAFIFNTYLPKKEEIKLQLVLRQFPQLWMTPELKISATPDFNLRKGLTREVICRSDDKLECILNTMLFELLPVCYLEGFSGLNGFVKQQAWPKKPKFIFTSNNFDTDEVFKLWAAQKTESGSKYIVGQHGNYGVSRNHIDPSIEEITADKFLTWGWSDGLPQHTPSFILKTAGEQTKAYDSKGRLLLIELCLNHRITTWDGTAEFAQYFDDQQCFIRDLSIKQRECLTIRLHAAYRYLNWSEEARWQSFHPALKIDTGGVAIRNLIAQSRLVVHSYDSTGILETLSQNIPTLAFWQNGFDHLRDSAKPYYQLLADAGIIHKTPASVAQKVNEIWDDVDHWWSQSDVQAARKEFCDRYARLSKNPVRELEKILVN